MKPTQKLPVKDIGIMHIILALAFLFESAVAWNVSQEIRERWIRDASPYYSECICESGSDITKSINILGKLEYPNDACLKCFMKCVEFKMGLILSDGTIVPEAWVRKVAAVTPEIARKCTDETNGTLDTCQKAYDWSQCLVAAVSYN
ncbi:hypothetical protein FQR65_LT05713 [Abscondita terminalis]|nr:hypothetical protein FQR65_LT05713 [Abscondita terminalis]